MGQNENNIGIIFKTRIELTFRLKNITNILITEMNLSHSLKTRLPTNVNIKLFHFFHFFFKYVITGLEEDCILTKIILNSIIYFNKTNKRTLG